MRQVQLEERVADEFWGWVEYTVCLRTRRRVLLHVRTLAEMIHDIPGVSRACPSSRMDI